MQWLKCGHHFASIALLAAPVVSTVIAWLLFAEALKLAQFTRRRSGADQTGCYLAERGAANDAPSAIYRGNEMIATQVRKLPDSVRGQ
jgi:hypothetical protein